MTKILKYILCGWALFAFSQHMLYSQRNFYSQGDLELAIINDPDGYLNVREGPSSSFEIVYRLFKDELYLLEPSVESSWWKTVKTEFSLSEGPQKTTGFVFGDRVTLLSNLPDNQSLALLFRSLQKYHYLCFKAGLTSTDDERRQAEEEIIAYSDFIIGPVMDAILAILKRTQDFTLAQKFFSETEEIGIYSASENNTIFMAELYVLFPDQFIDAFLQECESYRKGIAETLLFGLPYVDGYSEDDRFYTGLRQKLLSLKATAE